MTKHAFWSAVAFLVTTVVSNPPALAQSEFTGGGMPYAAFDKLERLDLNVGGSKLHVAFAPGEFALPRERVLAWIETSAQAVTTYYGKFPVASARILIVPIEGRSR